MPGGNCLGQQCASACPAGFAGQRGDLVFATPNSSAGKAQVRIGPAIHGRGGDADPKRSSHSPIHSSRLARGVCPYPQQQLVTPASNTRQRPSPQRNPLHIPSKSLEQQAHENQRHHHCFRRQIHPETGGAAGEPDVTAARSVAPVPRAAGWRGSGLIQLSTAWMITPTDRC